ncbi:MAG: polyprenyl diphosphate synthase [Candidatus Woesearchaeota archaeon]
MTHPTHVGIILDGNRRYAEKNGLPDREGHKKGAKKLTEILPFFADTTITTLTLYVFSTENFSRSKEEVQNLLDLVSTYCTSSKFFAQLQKYDTYVKIAGDLELFPEDIQQKVKSIEERTKDFTSRRLYLCFGYGGRQEILRGMKKMFFTLQNSQKDIESITENDFEQCLDVPHSPDLIIRTGGAKRMSNFLPWQSVYSEWFFLPVLWPEITQTDIQQVLDEFAARKRNFGK